MEDSKLVGLFTKLSGYERMNVRRLLLSPLHNRRQDLLLLFDYLQTQTQAKVPLYDKYAFWRACYGEIPYKDSKLRSTLTCLLHKIEDFFIYKEVFEHDEVKKYPILDKIYAQKQLIAHRQYNLEKFEEQLQTYPQNAFYWEHFYVFQKKNHAFQSQNNRDNTSNLQALTDSLELQFIAERLKQACTVLALQSLSQTQYETGMLEMVLEYLPRQRPDWLKLPIIGLYYYYYKAATQKDKENGLYFNLFIQLLSNIDAGFETDETRNLYKMGINYLIRQANEGDKDNNSHNRQLFGFYQQSLQKKILLEHGILSRFSYKNMVALGLRLGELDWVQDFIRTNTSFLAPKYQHIYEQYALGKYCFSTQNYPQALLHFQQVAYEEIFLGLDARVVQLKIFYETEEWEVLDSHLQSFKMFLIRRRKRLAYHYENYKNIIRFSLRLMRLQAFSKPKLQQLREKITTTPTLTEREWLLKMLEEKK